MVLAKSVLILNENETMSYLCHCWETPAGRQDRRAASPPPTGQEQPLHGCQEPAPRCSKALLTREAKKAPALENEGTLDIFGCGAAQRGKGNNTVTQQAQRSRTSPRGLCLTSPPRRPGRNITSNLTTLQDARNPPASKHAHAFNWCN